MVASGELEIKRDGRGCCGGEQSGPCWEANRDTYDWCSSSACITERQSARNHGAPRAVGAEINPRSLRARCLRVVGGIGTVSPDVGPRCKHAEAGGVCRTCRAASPILVATSVFRGQEVRETENGKGKPSWHLRIIECDKKHGRRVSNSERCFPKPTESSCQSSRNGIGLSR